MKTKNDKPALIPRLRFPEFQNNGEWEVTNLGLVSDYENGKAHEQDIEDIGDFIVVNSKFISSNGEVKKYTNTAFCPAQKGDILMVLSDVPNGKAIAKCFLVEENNRYTVNQRIGRIIPQSLNSKILYYLLNRNPYLLAFDDGVKQTNLRKEDVLNCPLLIPKNPKEQQKIASCLSSLDEVIAGERQRLELLKAHKKGLLQNLFPREGETVPKLRFPEFKDSGKWEVKIIGEIGETINGLTNKSANDFGKGSPFITYLQVYEDSMVNLDKCSFVNIELNEKQNTIHKGDILITTSSETPDEVGFASVMLNEPAQDTYLNSFCFCLRPHKKANLLPEFSRYLFRSNFYRIQINKIAQGITRFNLSKQSFLKVLLLIPPLPEQQKIADCLSSLDELINAQQQKIELLEQHKKGLLQGLFPNVNDVDNG